MITLDIENDPRCGFDSLRMEFIQSGRTQTVCSNNLNDNRFRLAYLYLYTISSYIKVQHSTEMVQLDLNFEVMEVEQVKDFD